MGYMSELDTGNVLIHRDELAKLREERDAALGLNEDGAQQIDDLKDLVIALRDQVIELGGKPTTEFTHIEVAHALLEAAESERDAALAEVERLRDGLREIDASFERQCDSVDPAVIARHVKSELRKMVANNE